MICRGYGIFQIGWAHRKLHPKLGQGKPEQARPDRGNERRQHGCGEDVQRQHNADERPRQCIQKEAPVYHTPLERRLPRQGAGGGLRSTGLIEGWLRASLVKRFVRG